MSGSGQGRIWGWGGVLPSCCLYIYIVIFIYLYTPSLSLYPLPTPLVSGMYIKGLFKKCMWLIMFTFYIGLANCVNGRALRNSGFAGRAFPVAAAQLCPCSTRAATDVIEVSRHGFVPVQLKLWVLKYAVHVVFMCHNAFFRI